MNRVVVYMCINVSLCFKCVSLDYYVEYKCKNLLRNVNHENIALNINAKLLHCFKLALTAQVNARL